MASLLDFFMTPSGGLLSGNVGPTMPRASGLLDAPGFGSAPASDSTLTRLREWAGQQLNPASLVDFPSPQGFSAPSFAQPMEPNPYIRAAASFVPVLGDALDISDVGRRAMNDPASLSGWDAFSLLPMVPLATAWHGSPHRFDKFSLEHIGRGEGAQAYGHGLYFAESPDVAKSYAPRDFDAEEKMMARYKKAEAAGNYDEMEMWENAMMHETPAEIRARYASSEYDDAMRATADRVASDLQSMLSSNSSLYKVDIPDEHIDRMLDWDAPLSEQPAAVREALSDVILKIQEKGKEHAEILGKVGDPFYEAVFDNGKSIYDEMVDVTGSQAEAAAVLRKAGIPGIKYLDGNSRTAGEGTHNFVLFDDDLVTILERNGETMP